MFYFISRSPSPPILPPHLFCLPHSVSGNLPIQMQTWKKHTAFRERAEMWGGMASTPTPSSPLPVGTEILLWFQFWPTLKEWATKRFEKCVLTSPPTPTAHTILRTTLVPWVWVWGGVPLETRICKPRDLLGFDSLLSPGLFFRSGIQVSCL